MNMIPVFEFVVILLMVAPLMVAATYFVAKYGKPPQYSDSCTHNCNQGRNCTCTKPKVQDENL